MNKTQISEFVKLSSPEQLALMIEQLYLAAQAGQSGLNGEYPWFVRGKYSRKEAQETALSVVNENLKDAHKLLSSIIDAQIIWDDEHTARLILHKKAVGTIAHRGRYWDVDVKSRGSRCEDKEQAISIANLLCHDLQEAARDKAWRKQQKAHTAQILSE